VIFVSKPFSPCQGIGQLTYGRIVDVPHCPTGIADQVVVVGGWMARDVDLLAVGQANLLQDPGRA